MLESRISDHIVQYVDSWVYEGEFHIIMEDCD